MIKLHLQLIPAIVLGTAFFKGSRRMVWRQLWTQGGLHFLWK